MPCRVTNQEDKMIDLILNKLKYTNDDEANLIISRLRYQIENLEDRLAKSKRHIDAHAPSTVELLIWSGSSLSALMK
uniref:Uncharacterized protein n=1 Tax=Vibrio phage Vc1 TaxID=1480731 RepID=A0A6M5C976_9CAUD